MDPQHTQTELKQDDLVDLIAVVLKNSKDRLLVEKVANLVLPYDYCHLDNDTYCEII